MTEPVIRVSVADGPHQASTTAMRCAGCGGKTGRFPWYVLRADTTPIAGPLCEPCAALHFPGRELSE